MKSIILLGVAIFMFIPAGSKINIEKITSGDDKSYDVIIVGGGISGLTAAYNMKDMNVMVLEKEDLVGGRIISGEWGGFHYPKGMEYTGTPEPEYTTYYKQLGITPVQVPPPTDAIAYDSIIYRKGNILGFLSSTSAKANYYQLMNELDELNNEVEDAVWDYQDDLDDYAALDNQSVAEWLQAQSCDPLIQHYVDIENRALFGANNQDLSMLFNIPEMAYNLPDTTEYTLSEVYTFPNGMIELVNALENQLAGKITTGATVTQVNVNNDLSVTVKYLKDGKIKTIHADCVLLTTPAPVTASIVSNGFSQEVTDALSDVKYAQYITLNLFTSERIYKNTWTISCLDDYFVTLYDAIRTQVPSSYNGNSILGVYIAPLNADDQTLISKPDKEILQNTYTDLKKYFPDIESKILDYDIQRFKYAFPVFDKNYHQIIQTIIEDPSTCGPLFLAGDYMVYATFDGALISAWNAEKEVRDYLKD